MEDGCQLNSVLAPVGVAIPDVVTITESIDHGDTWHAILDFGHVFSQSLPEHGYCAASGILGFSCHFPPVGGPKHRTSLSLCASDLFLL